jgi:hypothetical protein
VTAMQAKSESKQHDIHHGRACLGHPCLLHCS